MQVYFETSLVSDKRLLTRGRAQAGETERFFYGFPILLDEEDMLTPLFFAEVEIEPGNTGFTMRLTGTEGIQANEHILRSYGLQAEEVLAARAEMAGEYGTFEARVRAISQYLGLDAPNLASPDIEPLPRSSGGQRVWVRCPIVFRSERSVYTMHLRDELQKLASSKHLLTAVHSTALGHILGLPAAELTPQDRGERPKRRGVPATAAQPAARVLEVLPLNEAQAEAARQGLQETLTVVTGPPGTGKSQVVVDLLAGCALAEQPVLFASKNSKAVDVVCRRVESFLGRNENWLLRVGSKEKTEECRDRILAQLEALGNTATIADRAPSTDSLAAVESDLDECRRLLANVGKVRSALAEATKLRRSTFSRVPVEWRDAVNLTDWTLSTGLVFRKLEERLVFLAGKGRGRLGWRLAKVLAGGLWHKRLRRNLVRALSSLPEKVRQECEAELAASGSSETSA
ncbi:MAG: AAA domain-containing protein, partial [candidate division WOR-3 bacterium]